MSQLLTWLRSITGDKRKGAGHRKAKPQPAAAEQWEMSAKDALHVKTLKSKTKQ